jgi:cell division protein FtsL
MTSEVLCADPTTRRRPGARSRATRNGRATPKVHAHGWARATDPSAVPTQAYATVRGRRAPTGTSFLLATMVAIVSAIGIVRVHSSNEVLELGGRITELTQEQAFLAEEKRRLAAERAYLRHPEQIEDVARNKLGLVPITPELVQPIRMVSERPTPPMTEDPKP